MKDTGFCKYPFLNIRILPDGKVHSCCEQSNGVYGDLTTQSFDEVWFGSIAEEVRQKTRQMEFHWSCKEPGGCPWLFQDKYLQELFTIGNGYPTLLDIVLPNTHCNIGGENPSPQNPACIMCWRADPNFKPELDNIDQILPKIKFLVHITGFLHVQISGVCEPFWKDRIFDILDKLEFNKVKQNVRLQTTTNGILLNENRRKKFLEYCPLSSLRVSLDAATPETYKKLRIANAFEMILENTKAYSQERTSNQYLEIEFNINTINLNEAEYMLDIAAGLNPNKVIMYPTESVHQGCDEIVVNSENAQQFHNMERKIRKKALMLKLNLEIFRPFAKNFVNLVQIKL